MPTPGFDAVADGLNHLASALLDLAIPVLVAWGLWLAHRIIPPMPPGSKYPENQP